MTTPSPQRAALCASLLLLAAQVTYAATPLVLQSDFGNKDVAVASMKGVAVSVSSEIDIYDITHEIPTFNIWEASLRLAEVADYWPKGTVFVSVVDPGVGTERLSVVLKTRQGHYYVSPDNGSLTAVAEKYGIESVRQIDEAVNRLADSEQAYTFHGRDVYAYTGARLAAGVISFAEVGPELKKDVLRIPYKRAAFTDGTVVGNIEVLDPQYGNLWTNIDRSLFQQLKIEPGDALNIRINQGEQTVYSGTMPYHRSFGRVALGAPLLYLNSLNKVAIALNQGNFAASHSIESGPEWDISISPSR